MLPVSRPARALQLALLVCNSFPAASLRVTKSRARACWSLVVSRAGNQLHHREWPRADVCWSLVTLGVGWADKQENHLDGSACWQHTWRTKPDARRTDHVLQIGFETDRIRLVHVFACVSEACRRKHGGPNLIHGGPTKCI